MLCPTLSPSARSDTRLALRCGAPRQAACLVRVPTEVVKQRAQTAAAASSLSVAQRVWAQEGLRGFYRGFGSTVAREVRPPRRPPPHPVLIPPPSRPRTKIPFTCLQFPLYERLKVLLARRTVPSQRVADLPAHHAALCGSLAGGVAAGLTTPLDVCKTRIMLRQADPSHAHPHAHGGAGPGILATLRGIVRSEGPRALFRGVVPRVMWISGGGAVFLGVYEAVKRALAGPQARAGVERERRD